MKSEIPGNMRIYTLCPQRFYEVTCSVWEYFQQMVKIVISKWAKLNIKKMKSELHGNMHIYVCL